MANPPPTLVVVADDRPGAISPALFEQLRCAAPLTPIVRLIGHWCEGEARTGKPWPGAVRVGVHQFVTRVGSEFERLRLHGANGWTPPFTRADEDRALNLRSLQLAEAPANVLVLAKNRETAATLCDALLSAGLFAEARWPAEAAMSPLSADLVIWDFPAGLGVSATDFARFTERTPQIPKIVIVGFPRGSDEKAAAALGATAVFSKPFLIDDLIWKLRECLAVATCAAASQ
jgi:CheY-like chemotaxis protein